MRIILAGIAIGGDAYPGSTLSDHCLRYENIPQVRSQDGMPGRFAGLPACNHAYGSMCITAYQDAPHPLNVRAHFSASHLLPIRALHFPWLTLGPALKRACLSACLH